MATDLITLAEYKIYTGITSINSDPQIRQLIPIVSQFAKTFCARSFNEYVDDPFVQTYAGGYPVLILDEFPLISVNSVEYSNDFGKTYTVLTEYTDYVVETEDETSGFIRAIRPIPIFNPHNANQSMIMGTYNFPKKPNAYNR